MDIEKLFHTSNLKPLAEERLQELTEAQRILEKSLANSPEGKIHVVNSRNRIQYYLRKDPADKSGIYLAKDKKKTIKIFLQKSYNERTLRLIRQETALLNRFLHGYQDLPYRIRNIYSLLPNPIKELVTPVDLSDEDYANLWNSIPFSPKKSFDSDPRFITDRGEYVRSKSELNIANALNRWNIPYKYEAPLQLCGKIMIHPDFTVLNIHSRSVYYWEHRGMMDDRDYAKHAVMRIKEYEKAGIFPGKNLIITEETSSSPLGSREILQMIKTYLT